VHRNGQPGSEEFDETPVDRQEAAEHPAAGLDRATGGVDAAGEALHPAEPGAERSAGEPGTGRPGPDAAPAAPGSAAAPGMLPGSSAASAAGSAAPHPARDGAAGVRPPAAFGKDGTSIGTPGDGSAPAGAAATPLGPLPGDFAQFPAAAGAAPPPPGWFPPDPGPPADSAGPPPYAAGPPPYAAGPPPYAAGPPPYAAGPPPYAAGPPPYAAGPPPYPPGPYPPPYQAGPYAAEPPTAPPRRLRPSWAAPSPTRTHRWGLGAYLVAEGVFLITSVLIGVFVVGDAAPTASALALALSVPTVLAAATALLITRLRGNGPRIDLGLEWTRRDVGLGLAFGFGGLALTIPASIVYIAIVGEDATSAVGEVFAGIRAGPALAALVLVIVVFVVPFCEEILYRGLLWGGIEKLAGRWVAFVASTLLFAVAHFELTRTPLLLVVAIPIAIARLYTGRLPASIVAHQINNLAPGIVLVLGLLGLLPPT
jgi:membrane protease YdiL (CAAX protease family)